MTQKNLEAHSFQNLQMRTQPVNSLNVILRVENPLASSRTSDLLIHNRDNKWVFLATKFVVICYATIKINNDITLKTLFLRYFGVLNSVSNWLPLTSCF